ncbi:MAG: c-type cytochrome [Ramlibacter sp.]|nr:c-type cytochrome [Ramlibacter sp.]
MHCGFRIHDCGRAVPLALALTLSAPSPASPAAAAQEQSGPSLGSAARGQRLLDQYQCGRCHTIPGVPAAGGRFAASLQGFGARSYIAGRLVNGPRTLALWIEQPQALVPGTLMPAMGVSPADARDMAAYLLELR